MPARVIENERMPSSPGPYSQAVAASGELVFISGQPGIDPVTGQAPDGFEMQARMAFENLFRILDAAGLARTDLAKVTIYLTNLDHFGPMNDLFAEYFPTSAPTRAAPTVQLPKGLLISIEGVAVRG